LNLRRCMRCGVCAVCAVWWTMNKHCVNQLEFIFIFIFFSLARIYTIKSKRPHNTLQPQNQSTSLQLRIMIVSYAHKDSLRFQMFVVAFRQSTHSSRTCCDITHVEVGVTRTYAVQIVVIIEITLCRQQTFSSFQSSVHVQFSVSNYKLGYDGSRHEQHLAPSTFLYSSIAFA